MDPLDREFFAKLLVEATGSSMLGIRVGDHADVLRARHGEPDDWNVRKDLLKYDSVEFALDSAGVIQAMYVHIPDEVELSVDVLTNVPPLESTFDPEESIAMVGGARICVDSRTRRVTFFAL